MANSNDLFMHFNSAIKLSEKDREALKTARNSLRERVKNGYNSLSEDVKRTHTIEFQSQGSFVMDTIIKPKPEDDFDLDDGIYFQGGLAEEKRAETQVFHDLIIRAIDRNNEIEDIIDKPTCVRVKYYKPNGEDRGFHIDLPIYYAENLDTPELADTKNGWIESSPVEFIAWFEEKTKSEFQKAFLLEALKFAEPYEKWLSDVRKQDCQIRRIVRYLKVWANLKRKEMPSGIMISIMAANSYVENERDDISLKDTLINISNELKGNGCKCFRPTPKKDEDLFAEYSDVEKEFFLNSLDYFITSAKQAIESPSNKQACLKWKLHLGERFPCYLAKDEIEGAKTYAAAPIKNDNSRSAE
jgi:hypothetical protein